MNRKSTQQKSRETNGQCDPSDEKPDRFYQDWRFWMAAGTLVCSATTVLLTIGWAIAQVLYKFFELLVKDIAQ